MGGGARGLNRTADPRRDRLGIMEQRLDKIRVTSGTKTEGFEMDHNKKAARELIGLATKFLEQHRADGTRYTLIGAVEHFHLKYAHADADRGMLPLARNEALQLAINAIRQAKVAWIKATNRSLNYEDGLAEIEAAQADGFDLIAMASKQLCA
jgi:hypothetical protein